MEENDKDIEKDPKETGEQTPIEKFNDDLKDYLATRYELTLLKTTEKVSVIASAATFGVVLAIIGVLFILVICLAAGFYLSELLGSYGHGFMALSGIFVVIGIILFLGRKKWIMTPIRNYIVKEMFNED
jgi:ABC-type Fe3+-siderophore transport system permease subunit